MACIL